MSDPQRRRVRVRRSPRIGVFLLVGAVVGALVAIVSVNVNPAGASSTTPEVQTVAFLIALLAPLGALLAGIVALLVDRVSERRAKTVDAERIPPRFLSAPPRPADAAAAETETEKDEPAPVAPGDDRTT
jgi:hypothetical protein